MTSAKHLAETGNMRHLKLHFSNPETTIVKSELYLALGRRGSGAEFRVPDLLIAFGADPELYERNNGYVVSEQGKPPDCNSSELMSRIARKLLKKHGAAVFRLC